MSKEMEFRKQGIVFALAFVTAPALAVDLSGINMEKTTTRAVCNSRCVSDPYTVFSPLMARFGAQMNALELAERQELTPDKKAVITKEIAELNERIDEAKEKSCKVMCRNNPEN